MRGRLLARALLVYGVALVLRLRNIRSVLVEDRVLFGFDDPYYHLRRVFLILEKFPRVPFFDSYTNFPDGARITWPPGFDLLVATVAQIAGLGNPSPHRTEATAAILMPCLGALAAVVVMLLAEEILGRGRWEALGAGLLFAFLPAQQAVSTVGRLDHHVLELTFFSMVLLFFLRASRDDPGSRYSFWGGAALAGGVFCWIGSILYAGFLAAFGILMMILDRVWKRSDPGTGRSALRVLFWGSFLLVPLVLITPGDGRTSFTYLFLSWFQPALIGLAAILVASLSGAIFVPSGKAGTIRATRGFLISALVVILGAMLWSWGSGGVDFLTRQDPVIRLLQESKSVWELPPGQLVEYFSYLLYIAPLVTVALLWVTARRRFEDVRLTALLVWLLVTALLGARQARFLNYFAAPLCIALMWAFREVVDALRGRGESRTWRWSATTACFLLLFIPLRPILRDSIHRLPGNVSPALARLYPSLEWMRDHTPETSHYLRPEKAPEYGVLADFSFGHWITTIAQRPNFSNPFSLAPWHEEPIFESARLFLAEEEPALLLALDRYRLRYLLLYDNENAVPDYARLTGLPVQRFLEVGPAGKQAIPTPHFFRTLGVHLSLVDGSEYQAAGETVAALTGFRLVHESPQTRRRVVPGLDGPFQSPWVKIFERVPGARVTGTAPPGSPVKLSLRVTSNAGRTFDYLATATPGPDGKFLVTVPYPTGVSGEIEAGPARITTSACTMEARLTEEEVLLGHETSVRCP